MHKTKEIIISILSLIIWIWIWVFAYRHLEWWNFIESFYFSVITLATVWFWDLHPTNDMSRLFTAFYVLFGTLIVVSSIGIISSAIITSKEKEMLDKYKHIKNVKKK